MRTVLHVGCGPKTISGMPPYFQDGHWREVRLDIDPAVNPEVLGTMTDMGAVKSGSMSAVFSSHNVEHLYPHEVPVALAEFRRVLKPDGFALITCPDLQSVARLVADDKLLEPAYHSGMGPIAPLDILYGHNASIARGNHYMAHRGGFTARTLANALTQSGFGRAIVLARPTAFDLWALATMQAVDNDTLGELTQRLFPR